MIVKGDTGSTKRQTLLHLSRKYVVILMFYWFNCNLFWLKKNLELFNAGGTEDYSESYNNEI